MYHKNLLLTGMKYCEISVKSKNQLRTAILPKTQWGENPCLEGVRNEVKTSSESGRRPHAIAAEFDVRTPWGTPFHTISFCSH